LTKKVVDAARRTVWDTDVRGFGLRVRSSGRRFYTLKKGTGRSGRGRWLTIGEHGAPWTPDPVTGAKRTLTVDLARAEAVRLIGEVHAGRDPAQVRRQARAMPTLSEFAARYIEEHSVVHKVPAQVKEERRLLGSTILPKLGALRLDQVSHTQIGEFHRARRHVKVNANRCLTLLSHMFNQARAWGVLPRAHINPCLDVKRFKEMKRRRFLSPEELHDLGAILAGRATITAQFIHLLLYTGARPIELARLKWSDFPGDRLEAAVIRRKERELALFFPRPAREILEARRKEADPDAPYVFPNFRHAKRKTGHMRVTSVQNAWYDLREAAGLKDVRLYDLRHTFASTGLLEGQDLKRIGDLLGHSNPQTTDRYAHLAAGHLLQAAEDTAERLSAALTRQPGAAR
jgi:integrase